MEAVKSRFLFLRFVLDRTGRRSEHATESQQAYSMQDSWTQENNLVDPWFACAPKSKQWLS